MPDNGIRTMCKSQANPCFPTIFSFIDLFHEKRQAMYGSTSYQHRADPNVPAEEVHILMVNGTNVTFEYILNENDRVGLFPPVGGG